jgi:ABC-2 type transport system ATP-binding protein
MRSLAAEGRTVLVSSHLMSEMALTADHLIVIGRGRMIADTSVDEFIRSNTDGTVVVRSSAADDLTTHLIQAGATVRRGTESALVVSGLDSAEIGKLAAFHGLALSELTPRRTSLEDAFMELTRDAVEYGAGR